MLTHFLSLTSGSNSAMTTPSMSNCTLALLNWANICRCLLAVASCRESSNKSSQNQPRQLSLSNTSFRLTLQISVKCFFLICHNFSFSSISRTASVALKGEHGTNVLPATQEVCNWMYAQEIGVGRSVSWNPVELQRLMKTRIYYWGMIFVHGIIKSLQDYNQKLLA